MADFVYSSLFGELTKSVQARIDAASLKHKQLFDQTIYEQFLTWDTPSIGLNFEEIMGKHNISIVAPTIGDESMEPVIGSEGIETFSHSLYKHALTRPMTDQEYRKVLALQDSRAITDAQMKTQLIDLMWGNVDTVVKSVQNKIDLIFLTALSNKGVFSFDATNNPQGGVRESINYNMPTENMAKAVTPWDASHVDSVDVLEDIQLVLDAAQEKTTIGKILLDPSVISYILRTKKLRMAIFGNDRQSSPLFLNTLNEFMQANGLPVFQPIRKLVRLTQTSPQTHVWNKDNIVFVPDGTLGTIKNAYANSELRPQAGVSYSNYGRIRVAQWGVGESQNSNGIEFTKAESLSIPVITEINSIFNFNIKGE